MQALLKSCEDYGVDTMMESRVTQLIQDSSGRILGAKILRIEPESSARKRFALYYNLFTKIRMYVPQLANWLRKEMNLIEQEHTVTRLVRAKKGVVLSAGGFVFNRPMIKHHAPKYAPGAPLGSPGCNGNGIRLGESVGGATGNMGRGSSWRFINPPKSWVEGIIVNRAGERIVNEGSYGARIGEAMAETRWQSHADFYAGHVERCVVAVDARQSVADVANCTSIVEFVAQHQTRSNGRSFGRENWITCVSFACHD